MDEQLAEFTAEIRARVAGLGYELVDLRMRGAPKRRALQIRIDLPDARPGHGVTVDQCATVSRALEQWLDGTLALGRRYRLEVSSPGIERPVRWREHWERFTGRDVRVRLADRGRVTATIVRVLEDEDSVVLRPLGGTGEVVVPLAEARDATLVVDWSQVDRSMSR
ncbi:MAG: ribosome maturation factor RimP [Gemmatimonadales bacterium]